MLALEPTDRAWLHERIAQRFDAMLAADFLREVRGLRGRGDLHADLPSMRCVGYRQAWEAMDANGGAELNQAQLGRTARAWRCGHPPAGQTPAHLAALHARARGAAVRRSDALANVRPPSGHSSTPARPFRASRQMHGRTPDNTRCRHERQASIADTALRVNTRSNRT